MLGKLKNLFKRKPKPYKPLATIKFTDFTLIVWKGGDGFEIQRNGDDEDPNYANVGVQFDGIADRERLCIVTGVPDDLNVHEATLDGLIDALRRIR